LGKFDRYRIDLKGMQGDKMNFDFLLDNIFFANIDGPEVQKGKVNVKLEVKKTPRAYELNFQTEGIVWIPCDRCLDEMEQPVTSTDKIMVKFGREYGEDGDIIVVPEEDGDVNVAWFIYEFVALSVPMKHVHPPGKCNKTVTGKLSKHLRTNADDEDSNDFDTGGGDDDIIVDDDNDNAPTDPRWNELKKIIDNN
jgi:Predicted metal-binding, possibly nucleic acid-binding protein